MSSSVSLLSSSTRPPCSPTGNSTAARRSRKGQAESDPRAQGNTEGPTARLPASDLSPGLTDQRATTSAGNQPHFQPGTGLPQGDQRLSPRYLIRMRPLVQVQPGPPHRL